MPQIKINPRKPKRHDKCFTYFTVKQRKFLRNKFKSYLAGASG